MHPGREEPAAFATQAQPKEKHHDHILELCSTFFKMLQDFCCPEFVGAQSLKNKDSLNQCATSIHIYLSWAHLLPGRGSGSSKGVFLMYSWYSGRLPQRFNPVLRRMGTPLTRSSRKVTKHGDSTVRSSQFRKDAEQLRKIPHHMPAQ